MQRVKNSAVIIADCGCSQRSAPSLCRPQAELCAPGFGIYKKNSVAAWGLRATQWALTLAQIPRIPSQWHTQPLQEEHERHTYYSNLIN